MAAVAESRDLPLFPAARRGEGERPDPGRVALDEDFARGAALARRAALDPRFSEIDRRRLADLSRALRGLRDCYEAARNPRVREALLAEAVRVTRRISAFGARRHPTSVRRSR